MFIKETFPERDDIIGIPTNGTHLKNNFYFTYLSSSGRRSKSVYLSQKEGTISLQTMEKNLRRIIMSHKFASTMINYIYFVFIVVERTVKVEDLRSFAKNYGFKFTFMAVLWVGRPKIISYFTFKKKRFYLFIHGRQRERERESRDTGRGRSRLYAESLMWDSILGLRDHALSQRQMLSC